MVITFINNNLHWVHNKGGRNKIACRQGKDKDGIGVERVGVQRSGKGKRKRITRHVVRLKSVAVAKQIAVGKRDAESQRVPWCKFKDSPLTGTHDHKLDNLGTANVGA